MSNPNKKTTAYKLKKCRENCGLSQRVVADALGIDRSTYAFYENGRSQPKLVTLVKLAEIFNVDPASLLPCEGNTASFKDPDCNPDFEVPNPIYTLRKDEHKLVLKYRMLSDTDKQKVLAIITNISESED